MSKPLPPLRAKPAPTKALFASRTVLGILVAILAKLTGVAADDLDGIVVNAAMVWPVIVGILADLGALWARVKVTDFDKSIFARKDFWLQILSGLMTLAAAFGYDLGALQGIVEKGIDAAPAAAALIGTLFGIIGSLMANKGLRLSAPKGRVLPLLLIGATGCTAALATEPPRLSSCVALHARETFVSGVSRLWSKNDRLWPQRATLRVRFLDGSSSQQRQAWREFAEVDALVNLTFVQVTGEPSEIRVAFDTDGGHWSYVGTDCKKQPANGPTMNLALRALDFRSDWRRVAQHEMMHAIGFEHEHQSPVAVIPWDRPAVYAYYGGTQGWSKSQIDFNVLNREIPKAWRGTAFDAKSIMEYPIPGELTKFKLTVGWNSKRTASDDAELKRRYPN